MIRCGGCEDTINDFTTDRTTAPFARVVQRTNITLRCDGKKLPVWSKGQIEEDRVARHVFIVSCPLMLVSEDASNATCISEYVKQSPTADLGISSRHYVPA